MSQQKQTYATTRPGVGDMVVIRNGHPAVVSVDKESGAYTAHVIYSEAPTPSLRAESEWFTLTTLNTSDETDVAVPSAATAVACRVTAIAGEVVPRAGARMEVNLTSGVDLLGFNHRKRKNSGWPAPDFAVNPGFPDLGAAEWDGDTYSQYSGANILNNSRFGTLSFWFNVPDDSRIHRVFVSGQVADFHALTFDGNNHQLDYRTGPGQITFNTINYTEGVWQHFMASWHHVSPWDLTTTMTAYLNGVQIFDTDGGTFFEHFSFDQDLQYNTDSFTQGNTRLSDPGFPETPSMKLCLSELYYNTDERLDLTIQGNREKLISAGGGAVNIGGDGSSVTGSQPAFYAANGDLRLNTGYAPSLVTTEVGDVINCQTAPPPA